MAGLHPLLLSRMAGNMLVQVPAEFGRPSAVDVGLNLKYERKDLFCLSYARRSPDGKVQYSQTALALVKAYVAAFPELFNGLSPFMADANPDATS
eukprot:2204512-Rhodomonas_salina.1